MRIVQVSLDGPEAIQNVQRPTASQGESFATVYRTIKSFLDKGVEIVVHAVVTDTGVRMIPDIVRFFGQSFPGVTIHLEPSSRCGRGLSSAQQCPPPALFVHGFGEAVGIAKSLGVKLFYSGATDQLAETRHAFCGVSTPNFVVTPEGLVTACHEVAALDHPLAGVFIYGYFSRDARGFIFDRPKVRRFRRLSSVSDPACGQCFARFHCVGDCVLRRLTSAGDLIEPSNGSRCEINQGLLRHYLFERLACKE